MSNSDVYLDARGVAHRRAGPQPRIVSLVPSLTELLCELGLADYIVGRTGFCIHPRETVRRIPKVGGTKDIDVEKIRRLAPTHVIVNIDENRREIIEPLGEFVENIFVTHPLGPEDNLVLFEAMGFLFSRESQSAVLSERLRSALGRLNSVTDRAPANVLYLIWRDPWMTIAPDTYISRMLKLVNWNSHPQVSPARYPSIELADYVGVVDKVLLSSEPFPFRDRHITEIKSAFGQCTDVRLVDGEMLSWYGSRAISGFEYLGRLASETPVGATA